MQSVCHQMYWMMQLSQICPQKIAGALLIVDIAAQEMCCQAVSLLNSRNTGWTSLGQTVLLQKSSCSLTVILS